LALFVIFLKKTAGLASANLKTFRMVSLKLQVDISVTTIGLLFDIIFPTRKAFF